MASRINGENMDITVEVKVIVRKGDSGRWVYARKCHIEIPNIDYEESNLSSNEAIEHIGTVLLRDINRERSG